MTPTYIRVQNVNGEERAMPYCSATCAHNHGEHILKPWRGTVSEYFDYEFDETCTNCGVLIPASDEVPA